jgi:D-aminopeptidase
MCRRSAFLQATAAAIFREVIGREVMRNLITDVPGLLVGNAQDETLASGTTAILFEEAAVASADVRGGAPGTRETDLLRPDETIERIDAIVLSGGSGFGLDAPGGVQAWLRERGRGFVLGPVVVPIVPGAILFDLTNGGNKDWGRFPPYRDLGYAAAESAGRDFALGTVGAGYGAKTVNLKGGLGSASAMTHNGVTVGAIAAVNALGSATVGDGPHFWAAPFEQGTEFGGRGLPASLPSDALAIRVKGSVRENTTIALVATDATLTKAQAHRLAMVAHDGLARAIYPVHMPHDGDTVFAASTTKRPAPDLVGFTELCALAANVLARAVARGVYEATALPFPGALPDWRHKFG